jgi:polyisoprenoid-binding protein YceI
MQLKTVTLCLLSCNAMFSQNIFANTATTSSVAAEKISHNYKIDPVHSHVSFEVAHLVVSFVSGEFETFEGTFEFDPNNYSHTFLNASANTDSINTGEQKRDDHLKSPDFFNAKKYPKLTFQSISAKKTGDKTFDLMGNMTIHGVTKPATFHVNYNGQVKIDNKLIQAFKATTTINRQDFDVKFQNFIEKIPAVGDEVTIKITIEGNKV